MSMTNWWQTGQNPYAANMYQPTGVPKLTSATQPAYGQQSTTSTTALTPAQQAQTPGTAATTWTGPVGLPSAGTAFASQGALTSSALGGGQQQATTAATGGTLDPGWNHDMLGEKAGQTWDPVARQWVGGGTFRAAGSQLGAGGVVMTAAYDPNRDTSRYDISTHQGAETNWRRVNRWMEAGVREHGLTPQQAYDAALARLKRDYELNGQDWGTSGFDLAQIQSAKVGQDFGPNATNQQGQTVADQNGNGGIVTANGQTAGAQTGTTGAPMGAYYKSNPEAAAQAFLAQHNVANDNQSPFAVLLRQLASNLAPSLVQTAGMGGGAAANDQVAQLPGLMSNLIYGNGGNLFGNLGNYANQVMHQAQALGGGANSPLGNQANLGDVQQLLATILGLKTMGSNPLMAHAQSNALQSYFNDYTRQAAAAAQANNPNFSSPAPWFLQNDPYGLFSR